MICRGKDIISGCSSALYHSRHKRECLTFPSWPMPKASQNPQGDVLDEGKDATHILMRGLNGVYGFKVRAFVNLGVLRFRHKQRGLGQSFGKFRILVSTKAIAYEIHSTGRSFISQDRSARLPSPCGVSAFRIVPLIRESASLAASTGNGRTGEVDRG